MIRMIRKKGKSLIVTLPKEQAIFYGWGEMPVIIDLNSAEITITKMGTVTDVKNPGSFKKGDKHDDKN